MFDTKTLGYLRNLVNEQLRRQDCECLSEEKLQSLKRNLDCAIDGMHIRKLIKHIVDAMPDASSPNSTPEEQAALDEAMNKFYAKKFTIGFDGMSVTLPVGPELYDGFLKALEDYYDEYYAGNGMTYALRTKLNTVKVFLNYDGEFRFEAHDNMRDIINDLIALL